jgi:DNA gyrase subunit A
VLLDVIREDIYEIKEKYGDKRRTKIAAKVEQLDIEDLIAEEEVIVTISHSGYVKRMPLDTYRKQARGGKGIIGSDTKEGDFIEHLFTASTHDYLLIFTNRGRCYWLKVYDVPSMSRQSKGRNIVNLLKLGSQTMASIINVRGFDGEGEEDKEPRQLVMATKNGLVKKTKLAAYSNPRATGVNAIKLDPNDDVIGVKLTTGTDQVILGTRDGMAIRFDEQHVRSMGRVARGVRGIKLRSKDAVVDMVIPEKGASLLTVCEKGYGKRTSLEDYRSQSRGGIGLINIKTTARNGKVVALKAVHDKDELMMITAKGIIIRTGLEQVRSIGRATQGVRLIKLKADDKLVAVEKIVTETAVGQEKLETKPSEKVDDSKEKSSAKRKLLSAPKPERKKKSSGKTPKSK